MAMPQRKKLEGNGLWESSRMILPEHRKAMNDYDKESKRRSRISLDEQEWEDISRDVSESMAMRQQITLRMYHPFEELTIVGVVDRVDQLKKRFMVDGEWFDIKDIEGASINS
ncbi:YolD-like family protein [Paenibacillus sp. L3-i20]|uniref:YolD-like family protein n=1 Tax=Paenibacillus sp. L3-i20 TaxID=2905833 RepID=UPI001EE10B93|nr:YolD-like family protein [Paenibacillus sp. L3-i20]GKU79880.1 hypothetical protein L3i20_v242770 [Paenibacillus sp. L3-i20]